MTAIADAGKARLKGLGINQWQRGTYPDRSLFIQDVYDGIGYVVAEGDEVLAICAVTYTDELAYRHLLSGAWSTSDDAKYATVHRGAVSPRHQGKKLFSFLLSEAAKMAKENDCVAVRADTHPDNFTMQRSMERAGFVKCGEFNILEGDEAGDLRYAYEIVF